MAVGVKKRGDKWVAWIKINGRVVWGHGFRTQAEAVEWRNERVSDRSKDVEVLPARFTVSELIRRHFELFGGGIKPSTLAKYRNLLERYIETDLIGSRRARDVRKRDVIAFVNRVTAASSPAMAAKAFGLLRLAYLKAVELDELAKSPTQGVKVGHEAVELDVPTPAETGRLIAAVRPEYRDAAAFLAVTGLRRGELVALKWSAVSLKRRTLAVRGTAGWIAPDLIPEKERERLGITDEVTGHVLYETRPKTKAGNRTIVLLEDAVTILRRVREEQKARAAELGAAWDGTGGYVFTRPDGRQLDPNELSRAVTEAARSLGRRFRLHDLRHAYVTRCVEAGVPAAIVAGIVGHADAGFTQRVYFDPNPEQQRTAAAMLEDYLKRVGVSSGLAATHEADEDENDVPSVVTPLSRP